MMIPQQYIVVAIVLLAAGLYHLKDGGETRLAHPVCPVCPVCPPIPPYYSQTYSGDEADEALHECSQFVNATTMCEHGDYLVWASILRPPWWNSNGHLRTRQIARVVQIVDRSKGDYIVLDFFNRNISLHIPDYT